MHAVAWSEGPRPRARVVRAGDRGPGGDGDRSESDRVRDLLRDLVAAVAGVEAADVEVVRDPVPGSRDRCT